MKCVYKKTVSIQYSLSISGQKMDPGRKFDIIPSKKCLTPVVQLASLGSIEIKMLVGTFLQMYCEPNHTRCQAKFILKTDESDRLQMIE